LSSGKRKINKLKRWGYQFKNYGIASQNEPASDILITCNCRLYPDMKKAYDRFGKLFNLEENEFILTNGGENAMKIALLALKPKSMAWFVPTWKMPEVFCAALDIKPIMLNFHQKEKEIYAEDIDKECDIFYSNMGTSSLFKYYGSSEHLGFYENCRYQILDLTYMNFERIKFHLDCRKNHLENTIYIGSFDKLAGCGLRLGFIVFPKSFNDAMQLQREQYINMCAYEWLLNITKSQLKFLPSNPIQDFLEENALSLSKGWSLTDNFITIPQHIEANLNEVHFQIDGQEYTKFGQPSNDIEKRILFPIIKQALYNDL